MVNTISAAYTAVVDQSGQEVGQRLLARVAAAAGRAPGEERADADAEQAVEHELDGGRAAPDGRRAAPAPRATLTVIASRRSCSVRKSTVKADASARPPRASRARPPSALASCARTTSSTVAVDGGGRGRSRRTRVTAACRSRSAGCTSPGGRPARRSGPSPGCRGPGSMPAMRRRPSQSTVTEPEPSYSSASRAGTPPRGRSVTVLRVPCRMTRSRSGASRIGAPARLAGVLPQLAGLLAVAARPPADGRAQPAAVAVGVVGAGGLVDLAVSRPGRPAARCSCCSAMSRSPYSCAGLASGGSTQRQRGARGHRLGAAADHDRADHGVPRSRPLRARRPGRPIRLDAQQPARADVARRTGSPGWRPALRRWSAAPGSSSSVPNGPSCSVAVPPTPLGLGGDARAQLLPDARRRGRRRTPAAPARRRRRPAAPRRPLPLSSSTCSRSSTALGGRRSAGCRGRPARRSSRSTSDTS